MTTFVEFREEVNKSFNRISLKSNLFQSAIEKDFLWDLYLSSFPDGTNPVFRERSEHDCNCCKSFIRNVGRLLGVVDGKVVSIWDDLQVEGEYKIVADALSEACRSFGISGIYLNDEQNVGRMQSYEEREDGSMHTWEHFYQILPTHAFSRNGDIGARKGKAQTDCKVLKRSITEISKDAVEVVSDLIAQNSIHRGNEYAPIVNGLKRLQAEYEAAECKESFLWVSTMYMIKHNHDANIRGTAIGTLMVDLTAGEELEVAVKKYEDKVSGTNYKRTTALVTPRMKADAQAKAAELGIEPSLLRRFATRSDISINDVLFADNSVKPFMADSVFDSVAVKVPSTQKLDKVEELSSEEFIKKILHNAQSLEIFLENKHVSNLMSVIAPVEAEAPCIMKWGNNFSWNYNGEVAESVAKQRVKAAGGVVDAPFRISMIWNNRDDLDIHLYEPKSGHVYFASRIGKTGSKLDVDMRGEKQHQVENIFWQDLSKLQPGNYSVKVNNYNMNGTRYGETREEGFLIEVDHLGNILSLPYESKVPDNKWVDVLSFTVSDKGEITFDPKIKGTSNFVSKEMWGLKSGEFHKVNMMMRSPNMWDNSNKTGNDHLFFILDGCETPDEARGFYNEFLIQDLMPHRKVFEVLASNLKAQYSEDQLSGLGFSSTLRNDVIVRVKGSFSRTIKIKF